MRQYIKIILKDPTSMYVNSDEEPKQVIKGSGPLDVLLNKFTAKLILNDAVELADVNMTDSLRNGKQFDDISIPELVNYTGLKADVRGGDNVLKQVAKEKFSKESSEEVNNTAK